MKNKVLIFGGTGSLGRTLIRRWGSDRNPDDEVHVFSRDEAKHHRISLEFPNVKSFIGDIRDYSTVLRAIQSIGPQTIINAAAMKQVPQCEDFPYEAVLTNTVGAHNIVRAVEDSGLYPTVLSISTDKACKPVNSYGMTKALQERIHLNGKNGIFNCVRYGNVLGSTGSIIPVFGKLIKEGKNLTITHHKMTRFFLSLDQAVDLIFTALEDEEGGKIFVPRVPSALITDLANVMSNVAGGTVGLTYTGIRPGEKLDEILISEEELLRTEQLEDIYVIHDIKSDKKFDHRKTEYSSGSGLMSYEELKLFLGQNRVL